MRLRLDISYDGTDFHGWAAQPELRTVQGELEMWLSRLLRTPITLIVAGRTDAGVHARGQVAHFDLPEWICPDAELVSVLQSRLGQVLPEDLLVRKVAIAPDAFDARFSALWRRYVYRLSDGQLEPLQRANVAKTKYSLSVDYLNELSSCLLGLHDFVAFSKPKTGATTIRTLQEIHAERCGEIVEITVRADAFSRSMVRSLVGAIMEVVAGHRTAAWLASLVDRTERCGEITVMPAKGLTLEEVHYPPDADLAARAQEAKALRSLGH